MKLSDECHSSTVSEILQKVKEKSRASPSPEKDAEQQKENQQLFDNSGKDSVDGKNETASDVLRVIDNSSKFNLYFPTFTISRINQCDVIMSYNFKYTTKLRHNVGNSVVLNTVLSC
jgi:hypothetical protein